MPTACATCWSPPATACFSFDRQPMARMGVLVLAREGDGVPQHGYSGGGGRVGLEFFETEKTPEHFASEAARQAIVQLGAIAAPAGEMTVVLGPGWPGVLLHEAVGHGLEADFNRKGVSAFSDRIGQQVASPLCTVIDDGTIAQPPRIAQRRRRRRADAAKCADRKGHPARLSARQAFQPPARFRAPPAADAAKAISTFPCRA